MIDTLRSICLYNNWVGNCLGWRWRYITIQVLFFSLLFYFLFLSFFFFKLGSPQFKHRAHPSCGKDERQERPWSLQSLLCKPCGLLNKNRNWENKEETITESSRKRLDIQFIVQATGDRMTRWEIRKERALQKKEIREIKKLVFKKKQKAQGNWKYTEIEELDQMKWRGRPRRWDKHRIQIRLRKKTPRSHCHRTGRGGTRPLESRHLLYPAFLKHKLFAGQTDSARCFYF